MLEFDEVIEKGKLIEARNSERNLRAQIHSGKLGFISSDSTPEELRQIADKLDELNKSYLTRRK